MSIALERSGDSPGIIRGIPRLPVYDSPEIGAGRMFPGAAQQPGKVVNEPGATSCSSSIGRNSDHSRGSGESDGVDSGEPEVQSALKGPLDTMDALEASLPIRRGISKFYSGKSKSFTSLADVSSSSSVKDLAKPEKCTRKRKNHLQALCSSRDRHHSDPMRDNNWGSTSKRLANSSRRMLSPMCGTSSSDSNSMEVDHELPRSLPPLHPNGNTSNPPCGASPPQRCHLSARSFSLTDLQGASTGIGTSSSRQSQGRV